VFSKLKEILLDKSFRYTVMSIIGSGINFLTLIIFGRIFSVTEYGAVTTLQAFLANICAFVNPLQNIICGIVAEKAKDKTRVWSSILNIILLINIIEMFAMTIATSTMVNYLNLSASWEYYLFIVLVVFNNAYILLSGVVQGKQEFILLGWLGIIFYSGKLVIGVVLGALGFGVKSVIISTLFSATICVLLVVKRWSNGLENKIKTYLPIIEWATVKQYIWVTILYIVLSMYLNNSDLLLANLYCSEEEIGLYSVAISLSKISVFLIATPIATILLPKIAECKSDRKKQNKLFLFAELITLFVSVIYGAFFCLLGGWIIKLLYGVEYEGAASYILPCVAFSAVLGMFYVFYQYVLVTDMLAVTTIIAAVLGGIVIVFVICTQTALEYIPLLMSVAMVGTIAISFMSNKIYHIRQAQ